MTSAQRLIDQTSQLAETLSALHGAATRIRDFSQDKLKELTMMCQNTGLHSSLSRVQYSSYQDVRLCPRGILVLPDELIRNVFKLLQEDDGREEFHGLIMFASVSCRRLRAIVISTSSFWNKIYMHMHPDAIDAFLLRSGKELLDIVSQNYAELFSFEKVLQHRQRWRSLSLAYRFANTEMFQRVTARLTGLNLPNLCRLNLQFPDQSDNLNVEDVNEIAHVYRSWVAPSLREASLYDTVPRFIHGFQLKKLFIEIELYGWIQTSDPLATLMSCLASQPMLEDLTFIMLHFPLETEHSADDRVNLPLLRSLHLGVGDGLPHEDEDSDQDDTGTSFAVPAILTRLITPVLESLHVGFVVTLEDSFTFEIDTIFPSERDYTTLRGLSLSIYETNAVDLETDFTLSPFSGIFEQMPNLEDLCLEIPDTRVQGIDYGYGGPLPPLQCLKLYRCFELNVNALRGVLQVFRGSPNWGKLKLNIESCPELQGCTDALTDLLPPERIQITDSKY